MLERLAEVAAAALEWDAVGSICRALRAGRLRQDSTPVVHGGIASGRQGVEGVVARAQTVWRDDYAGLSGTAFAAVLEACAEGIRRERRAAPRTQVVWTGPEVLGSYVRATREVVRELLRGAERELLIVGYWLAAPKEQEGIIHELIQRLGEAAQRGVAITMLLDGGKRTGPDNRAVLRGHWPDGVAMPRVLAWRLPDGDTHAKLHAKVIVADGRDALVTSANLTWHALERNIEMGIRISGAPAAAVARHFRLLAEGGELE